MSVKDSKTEQLIKDTAKRVFLTEGKMFATTQDIADAAGVNRTLLHYYFRSKEVLFNMVFLEALAKLRQRLACVMKSEAPFKQKIDNYLTAYFEELTESPYLEPYIILQVNQDSAKYAELFTPIEGIQERMNNFLQEIQHEMDKGTIQPMKPIHFFMNLFALMAYPLIAKPIYLNMFNLGETTFSELLKERKKVIMSLLFKET